MLVLFYFTHLPDISQPVLPHHVQYSCMQKSEFQPRQELEPELVHSFARTFIPRFDQFPVQRPDGHYVSLKKQLSLDLLTAHLHGFVTLGAYALDTQSQAKWICMDADTDEQWVNLQNLATNLLKDGITSYLELSRRGGHLWLFFSPLPGADARRFGKQLLEEHKLEDIELYPKQNQLNNGPGSLVRLPLGRHRKTGRRYHFITPDSAPLAPTIREQIALLGSPALVPQEFIDTILASSPSTPYRSPTPRLNPLSHEAAGGTVSERLKNRISAYEFVSHYVQLDDNGAGYCPFHDDQRQSFGVNQEGNYWHCWAGCGGGSLIDFWMKWREKHGQDGSFKATIAELAQMLL